MTRFAFLALLALAAATPALAQQARRPTASDRFHQAARLYVGGDSTGALRAAEAGLAQAPNDPRLRALAAEIRRRPPPQPPQGGGGQNQPRPNQDGQNPPRPQPPQNGNQGGPPQQPPQQHPRPQQPRQQTPQNQGRQPQPQQPRPQQPPRQPQPGQGTPGQPQPGTPPPAGTAAGRPTQMTRAEAEALLRALGADERRLLRTRPAPTSPAYVEKDW